MPWGPTLTILYTNFCQKRDPFRISLIDKWHPFYIAASFLTSVNVPPLSYEQVAKPDSFLMFFTAIKCAWDRNDRFSARFIYFNKSNPYSLTHLKPEKGTPFWRSLPVKAILASTLSSILCWKISPVGAFPLRSVCVPSQKVGSLN